MNYQAMAYSAADTKTKRLIDAHTERMNDLSNLMVEHGTRSTAWPLICEAYEAADVARTDLINGVLEAFRNAE